MCKNSAAVQKRGNNNNINYRPNSLLPSVSKSFDRVYYNRLLDYFTYFNYLIFCNPIGLRPKKSTVDALAHINETKRHDLTHGDEPPVAVFLELKKTFDTDNHSVLK